MSDHFQNSVNSTGGELEVSILQSQYSKSGLSCGSGIHIEKLHLAKFRVFSSSIISRTVGEGKKARAKWAPSLGGD